MKYTQIRTDEDGTEWVLKAESEACLNVLAENGQYKSADYLSSNEQLKNALHIFHSTLIEVKQIVNTLVHDDVTEDEQTHMLLDALTKISNTLTGSANRCDLDARLEIEAVAVLREMFKLRDYCNLNCPTPSIRTAINAYINKMEIMYIHR